MIWRVRHVAAISLWVLAFLLVLPGLVGIVDMWLTAMRYAPFWNWRDVDSMATAWVCGWLAITSFSVGMALWKTGRDKC